MKSEAKPCDYPSFQSEWSHLSKKTKNKLRPYFYFHHLKENVSKIAFMGLIIASQWPLLAQNLDLLRYRFFDSLLMVNLFFAQLIRISWSFIAY
jgi:hypothetical protein